MKKFISFSAYTLIAFSIAAQDIQFDWAGKMGGGNFDVCYSHAVGLNGNIYSTGYFRSTADFDPGEGIHNLTSVGNTDVFISCLDPDGNFLWANRTGGSGYDEGASVTLDTSGDIIITGRFSGTVDFDPGINVYNLTSLGDTDIFIAKFDTNGNFIWAIRFGGTLGDAGIAVSVNSQENITIAGYFSGTVVFNTGYTFNSNGAWDIFILNLSPASNFIWARQIGGTFNDAASSLAIDLTDNIYLTGYFFDIVDFNPGYGQYYLNSNGVENAFILKLNSLGNFIWAKQFGSTIAANSFGTSLTVDAAENVYTTGGFEGTIDFDPGSGTYNIQAVGGYDPFISKLNSSGNFIWAKTMGGSMDDVLYSITLDPGGNIFTAGCMTDTVEFNSNIFFAKHDNSGNFCWQHNFQSDAEDYYSQGRTISVDESENIIISGNFYTSIDFDPGNGAYYLTPYSSDIFVLKLTKSLPVLFSSGFESGSFTSEGWITSGNAQVSNTSPVAGYYCARGSATWSLKKTFTPPLNDDFVTAIYSVKTSQVNKSSCLFKITDQNNRLACRVSLLNTGQIAAINGRPAINLMPYFANTWYTIKIILDFPSKKYDVYVDDILLADNFNFYPSIFGIGFSQPVNFTWESFESGNSIAWLDEVYVYSGDISINLKNSEEIEPDIYTTHQSNLLTVYPNPCNQDLTISHLSNEPVTIEIYDLTGQKVISSTIENNSITVETSSLDDGIYFIMIRQKEKTIYHQKIIVVH